MRSRLRDFLQRNKIKKVGTTQDHVGMSAEKLIERLENHPNWRSEWSWTGEERRRWHIDHVMPMEALEDMIKSGITKDVAMRRLCHYSNLQPLEARENISKSSKKPTNWRWSIGKNEWRFTTEEEELQYNGEITIYEM